MADDFPPQIKKIGAKIKNIHISADVFALNGTAASRTAYLACIGLSRTPDAYAYASPSYWSYLPKHCATKYFLYFRF